MALTEAQLHAYHLHVVAATLPINGHALRPGASPVEPAQGSGARAGPSSGKPGGPPRKGRKASTAAGAAEPLWKKPRLEGGVQRISLPSGTFLSRPPRPHATAQPAHEAVIDSSTLPPESPASPLRPEPPAPRVKSKAPKRPKTTVAPAPLRVNGMHAASSSAERTEEMDVEEVNQLLSSEPADAALESEDEAGLSPLDSLHARPPLPPSSPVFHRAQPAAMNRVNDEVTAPGTKKKKRKSQVAQEGPGEAGATPVKTPKKRKKASEPGPNAPTPAANGPSHTPVAAQSASSQTPVPAQTPGKASAKLKRKSIANSATRQDAAAGTTSLPPVTPLGQPSPAPVQTPVAETSTKKSKKARKSESGATPTAAPVPDTQESSATAKGSPKKKKRKSIAPGGSQSAPGSQDMPAPLVPSSQVTAESTSTPAMDGSTKKKKEKRKSLTVETPSGLERKQKKERKGPTWVVETPRPVGH